MRPSNPMRHPFRVARAPKPRAEGRFYLPNGRRLGFAEYGDPAGAVVFWFHGTPGGRRQFPLHGRRAADNLGLRVIAVERPGTHLSDPHRYETVAEWATDMAWVADSLGAERLAVIGLSGGGPYALACGAVPPRYWPRIPRRDSGRRRCTGGRAMRTSSSNTARWCSIFRSGCASMH